LSPRSKPIKSVKMNAGQRAKITRAIDDLEAHYADFRSVWFQIPAAERAAILAVCPLLNRVLRFAEDFK
jgi:hypothetical protein